MEKYMVSVVLISLAVVLAALTGYLALVIVLLLLGMAVYLLFMTHEGGKKHGGSKGGDEEWVIKL